MGCSSYGWEIGGAQEAVHTAEQTGGEGDDAVVQEGMLNDVCCDCGRDIVCVCDVWREGIVMSDVCGLSVHSVCMSDGVIERNKFFFLKEGCDLGILILCVIGVRQSYQYY